MNVRTIARALPVFLFLFVGLCHAQQTAPSQPKPGSEPKPKQEQHLSKPSKLHVALGTVSVGAFYAYGPCPVFAYGCYGAMPFAAPYPYPLFYPAYFYSSGVWAAHVSEGRVELQTNPTDASVYINGAYAGPANRLKKFPLGSGAYNLEVRAKGYRPFRQRIYILSDRTLKISAHLVPLLPQPGGKP